jgi:hypothetical protein
MSYGPFGTEPESETIGELTARRLGLNRQGEQRTGEVQYSHTSSWNLK